MSSRASDILQNSVDNIVKEITKSTKNKFEIAMESTAERVKEEIGKIIKKDGLEFYYNGYDPVMYVRTNQLKDSGAVSPKIELFKKNGMIGFFYGARFDESLMDHRVYNLKMVYKHKKDNRRWEREYTYIDDDVDEEKILDNFRFGLHPLGYNDCYKDQGLIWKTEEEGGREGRLVNKIARWKQSGAIKDIFLDEFKKLKK